MSKALHLTSAPQRLLANQCLGSVLAVIGATTTAITTTGTPALAFDGILTPAAAQTNLALSALAASSLSSNQAGYLQPSGLDAAFYVQPANTTVYYVLGVVGGSTWKVVQGTYDTQALPFSGVGRSVIPDVPDGFVPVAVIKVVTSGATFTVGTTSLGTGGQTSGGVATIKNVSVLPAAGTF